MDQLSSTFVLLSYILSISRIHTVGSDKLTFAATYIIPFAFLWRCNHFALNTLCLSCGKYFTRVYIHKCGLLDNYIYLTLEMLDIYKNEFNSTFFGSNYTILDSLLNHGCYNVFYQCIQFLQECLE